MVDLLAEDSTQQQAPTLTELEEARACVGWARHVALASEDMPDVEVLLAQLVSRPEWHQRAACRGVDPDLFFPLRGDGHPAAAFALCEACSVRSECLASGLEVGSTVGVWGGTTGRQRRSLRRSVT